MNKLLFVLSIVFLELICFRVSATHVMGADMTWECLGNDSFKVTLNIYRDCNGLNIGSITIMARCDSTGIKILDKGNYSTNPLDITPVCSKICTQCDSNNCNFKFGIHKYTIVYIIDLSKAQCCNVRMSFEQCCRDQNISTGAFNEKFYYEAILNHCIKPCDNSPKFNIDPVLLLCKNHYYKLDFGGTDIDVDTSGNPLDSVVYSITKPLTGHGSYTSWYSPYGYGKPIYFWGFPNINLPNPRGFHLNASTGVLDFRPMKEQGTILSILAREYRKGKKIGQTRRDVEIIVASCGSNSPPIVLGLTSKRLYNLDVCSGDTINYKIDVYDPNKNDSVSLEFHNNLPGNAELISDSTKNPSIYLHWRVPEFDSLQKSFSLSIKATDDHCPIPLSDYKTFTFNIKATQK